MADGAPPSDPPQEPTTAPRTATGVSTVPADSTAPAEPSVHIRRRRSWLRASAEVTAAALADAPEQALLDMVAHRARVITDAWFAAVAVPGTDPSELVVTALAHATTEDGGGPEPSEGGTRGGIRATGVSWFDGRVFEVEGSVCGQVFRSGSARALARSTPDGYRWAGPQSAPLPGALLVVPLHAGDHVHGVLVVAGDASTRAFGQQEQELAELFAGHVALALGLCRAGEDRRRLAVCEDRERIARDLHDLVIQRLFGIGLGLQGVAAGSTPESAERLADLVGELDAAIEEIRRTIFALQSPAGEAASLRAVTVETCSAAAPLLGFEPHLRLAGPLDLTTPTVLHPQVVAVLRETLSNAARHAGASMVEVLLRADTERTRLELTVTDDGRGMPPTPRRRSGLANLAARARLLGGQMTVDSAAGSGTRVYWWVPLGPPPTA